MKLRKLICLICYITLLTMTMSALCYATDSEDYNMVYVSGEQLDEIYESFFNEATDCRGILYGRENVVKESITPVYSLDLLKYAETGELEIEPFWAPQTGKTDDEKGYVYTAKLVTKDNKFAGNIMFYVEDGVARHLYSNYSIHAEMFSDSAESYAASSSYADHTVRIANILGEDKPISVKDVRYVFVGWVGKCFYIKNEKHDILIPVGSIPCTEQSYYKRVDYTIDPYTELLEIAKEQKARFDELMAEKAEWEAAHPGEEWRMYGGESVSPVISECSQVDNILDIPGYLGIDYSLAVNENLNKSNQIESTDTNSASSQNDNNFEENQDSNDAIGCASSLSGSLPLIVSVVSLGWIIKKRKLR